MNAWSAGVVLVAVAQRADCSGTQPPHLHPAPVLHGLVQLYNMKGGLKNMPCHYSTSEKCHWFAHTHQALTRVRRKVRLQLYSSRVFMTSWHHQARWWSAVSCSVWFSSANRISNNTSSRKTCQWRIELRLAHNSEERKGTQNNECVQEKSRFVRRCVVITTCRQSQFQLRWPVPLLSLHTSVTPDPPTHNTTLTLGSLWHMTYLSTPSYTTSCMMGHTHVALNTLVCNWRLICFKALYPRMNTYHTHCTFFWSISFDFGFIFYYRGFARATKGRHHVQVSMCPIFLNLASTR